MEDNQKEFDKVMDDYTKSVNEYNDECNRVNYRILKAIKSIKSDRFYEDLLSFMEDSQVCDKFKIVRKPVGNYQYENHGKIKRAWIDQRSVGETGDCWVGTVTVKIKLGRWLEMPFSM